MAFHPRSENPAYDTTVWDELQKKHGNLPGIELGRDRLRSVEAAEEKALEEVEEQQAAQADKQWEATALRGELDNVDEEDEKFMVAYREKRLRELSQQAKRARFGEVITISSDSFRQEVTDAADDELRVVVHLYADNTPECQVVDKLLRAIAKSHPHTKFARIFYLNAIPNYPPCNLPTILVYHKHDIALNIVTLRQLGGLEGLAGSNGERIMRAALSTCGAVRPIEEKDAMTGAHKKDAIARVAKPRKGAWGGSSEDEDPGAQESD